MTEVAPKGLGRRGQVAVVAFVGAIAATAAFIRLTGGGAVTPPQCQATLGAAARTAAFAKGDVALFRPARVSRDLSDLAFADASGRMVTVSSFAPRAVLMNFWATWCVPCRAEMPALDRLQSALGGPDTTARHPAFQVVAVNLDTGASASAESEQAFLSQVGVTQLPLYRDPHLSLTRELKRRGLVFGLPTTILVDGRGCEIGTAEGGIAWDSADAQSLITAAISSS